MARRAGRAARQPEPADDGYFEDEDPAAVLADLEDEGDFPDGAEEDAEYVTCPICAGRNRACRYCEGFGDVHPDDIDAIVEAFHAAKQKKVVIGIGAFLFVGVLVAVFMVVYQSQKPQEGDTEATGGGGGTGATGAGGQPAAVKKDLPPLKRNKEVSAIIVEMRLDMKIKDYNAVIQKGTEALAQTQDEVQRRNLQDMINRAKQKLGQ